MSFETFKFNGVEKFYSNGIIIINNRIINEQWYRWQIKEICKILKIKIKDEIGIEYSNEMLINFITILMRDKEVYDNLFNEYKKENSSLLKSYGLELIKKSIPITIFNFNKNNKDDINKNKMKDKWKPWEASKYKINELVDNDNYVDVEEYDDYLNYDDE